MMSEFLHRLDGWHWLVLGTVLMGLELVIPGTYLLWLGLAAMAVGLVLFPLQAVLDVSWQAQLLLFLATGIVSVGIGIRYSRRQGQIEPEVAVNRPDVRHMGKIYILETAITAGSAGRVKVDDSFWRVEGPILPAGTAVEVTGMNGASLIVRPAPNPGD